MQTVRAAVIGCGGIASEAHIPNCFAIPDMELRRYAIETRRSSLVLQRNSVFLRQIYIPAWIVSVSAMTLMRC